MKLFVFRYILNVSVGNKVADDIIFAESLEEAISFRKKTMVEKEYPSDSCSIGVMDIVPGVLQIVVSNINDNNVSPCIINETTIKFGDCVQYGKNENNNTPPDVRIKDLYNLLNVPSSTMTRFINSCHHEDVMTIQDLLKYTRKEVIKFRWMGYKTVMVVGDAIEKHFGISWK